MEICTDCKGEFEELENGLCPDCKAKKEEPPDPPKKKEPPVKVPDVKTQKVIPQEVIDKQKALEAEIEELKKANKPKEKKGMDFTIL